MSIPAQRVQFFTESVIREMTRLAAQHDALNLGQGMPDFDTPAEVKDAACKAIQDGFNQYAITWGCPAARPSPPRRARSMASNAIPRPGSRSVAAPPSA